MKILITKWHGMNLELSKKMDAIATLLPRKQQERCKWEFNGTLDEFYEKWGEKFLFYPNKTRTPEEDYDAFIYVTDPGEWYLS